MVSVERMSKLRKTHKAVLEYRSRPACSSGRGPCSNITTVFKQYLKVEKELPTKTEQKKLLEV